MVLDTNSRDGVSRYDIRSANMRGHMTCSSAIPKGRMTDSSAIPKGYTTRSSVIPKWHMIRSPATAFLDMACVTLIYSAYDTQILETKRAHDAQFCNIKMVHDTQFHDRIPRWVHCSPSSSYSVVEISVSGGPVRFPSVPDLV